MNYYHLSVPFLEPFLEMLMSINRNAAAAGSQFKKLIKTELETNVFYGIIPLINRPGKGVKA